jgi:hypothetical protein
VTTTELPPDAVAWLRAAQAAKTEISRLQEICQRAIEHVQQAMGDHDEATISGRPAVTWAWSKPGQRLDRRKLEEAYGAETIAAYLVDNQPARPFKIISGGDQ